MNELRQHLRAILDHWKDDALNHETDKACVHWMRVELEKVLDDAQPTPADVEHVARAIHDANGNWTRDPTVTWDNRFDSEYPKALSWAMARAALAAMGGGRGT